jgi:hypothetical protein
MFSGSEMPSFLRGAYAQLLPHHFPSVILNAGLTDPLAVNVIRLIILYRLTAFDAFGQARKMTVLLDIMAAEIL